MYPLSFTVQNFLADFNFSPKLLPAGLSIIDIMDKIVVDAVPDREDNRRVAQAALEDLYQEVGFSPTKIIWAESPAEGLKLASQKKVPPINFWFWFSERLFPITPDEETDRYALHKLLYSRFRHIEEVLIKGCYKNDSDVPRPAIDAYEASQVCSWKISSDERGIDSEFLRSFFKLISVVGWWWAFEDVTILCKRPVLLQRNENWLVHGQPAVRFPDGFEIWAGNGFVVPRDDMCIVSRNRFASLRSFP